MSDAAAVPLGARLKFLIIGALAGAALVYGLRPPSLVVAATPAPGGAALTAPAVTAAGGPVASSATSTTNQSGVKPAVEDAGLAPVAMIDGQPITLRQVENALLRQEGVQQLLNMLDEQFKLTNWDALGDKDILLQTNSWRVTRLGVAAQLLKQKAGDAREDLIGIALVQNALKKENVVIDDALIANEVKRMEKRHYEGLEARKQPYIDFATFIEQTQKMPLQQYTRQEGFRMGAGIRVLVERRAAAELTEDQLKEWFAKHIERYRVQASADISDIYIPYQKTKAKDGTEHIAQEEKDRLMGVMGRLHQSIFKREVSFERLFQTFGRIYDQNADANGRLGWVNQDGTRPIKGSRRVDQRAMEDAFAAQPPYPVLLSPVASEQGVELLLVHARRSGKEPVFAELTAQLVADIVDSELAPRTKRTLDDLRRAAVIDYRSLPPLIERRGADAGLPSLQPGQPGEAPAP
ncbi:MAG TPA: hypothetical protein VHX44_01180 [Planctomycetota bacterium]|nr:hypothetical protein [Planctomycetota bacterium]